MEGMGGVGGREGARGRRPVKINQALRRTAGRELGSQVFWLPMPAWRLAGAPLFREDVGRGGVGGAADLGNSGGRVLLFETFALPRAD